MEYLVGNVRTFVIFSGEYLNIQNYRIQYYHKVKRYMLVVN